MHEITLIQGISLAALVFVLGIDFWLEALFLFRPIIVCTLTGAILGDIHIGLITGGLTELAFAGLTPAGGVQPPNPIMELDDDADCRLLVRRYRLSLYLSGARGNAGPGESDACLADPRLRSGRRYSACGRFRSAAARDV